MKKFIIIISLAVTINSYSQIHWHLASNGIPAANAPIDLEATANNDLYVLCQALEFGDPFTKIFKSTNSGVTWTEIVNDIPKGNPLAMTISGGKMLVAVYESGARNLYSSADFGASFTKITTVAPNTEPAADLITTQAGVTYLVSREEVSSVMNPLIHTSNDNGQTWTSVNVNSILDSHFPLEIFFTTGKLLFATEHFTNGPPTMTYRFYSSSDGGQNWTQTGTNLPNYARVFVNMPSGIMAFSGTAPNLMMNRSTDGGDNWTQFSFSGGNEMENPVAMEFVDGAIVLLAKGNTNNTIVYRSVSPSGIRNNSEHPFLLYPSPAIDFITFEGFDESFQLQSATVISSEGRVVKQFDSNFEKLETAALLPGVYVLKITAATGKETNIRFVKASR